MKLIIDIDKETYNDILRTHINMRGVVGNAIAIGTPIPDNAAGMKREEIIRNLKYTMEKHKNDTVNTFGTNISVMCKDILDYLEQEELRDKAESEQ